MALIKRPSTVNYWTRFQLRGRLYQRSTGTPNKRAAEAFERAWRTELEQQAGDSAGDSLTQGNGLAPLAPTIAVLREKDIARLRTNGATEAYINTAIKAAFEHLCAYFPDVSHINEAGLQGYVAWRRTAGVRAQTIAKELVVLRRGLKSVGLTGPAIWPKLKRDRRDPKLASKPHSDKQWAQFLAALSGEAWAVPMFCLATGLRREEAYRVTLADVGSSGLLTVHEKVMRPQPRVVYLGKQALRALVYVPFKADHKSAHGTASRLAGASNITLRDCRAAFSTAAGACGDEMAVQLAMGHSSIPMRYSKANLERLEAVSLAVERWLLSLGAYTVDALSDRPGTPNRP